MYVLHYAVCACAYLLSVMAETNEQRQTTIIKKKTTTPTATVYI